MPITTHNDLFNPQILVDAIQAEFQGMVVLQGTKAVIVNDRLPNDINGTRVKGGSVVTVPYFNSMGRMLEKVTNDGDALTPRKLTMSNETATVGHFGLASEITTWAGYAAEFADPYGEMSRQMKQMAIRRVEAELITTATTGLSTAFTDDLGVVHSMINDLTVGGTVLGSTISWQAIALTKLLFGDEQGKIELISMHSKVYTDLLTLTDAVGRPLLIDTNDGTLPRVMGIPILVSDLNNTGTDSFGAYYDTLIMKENALVWWYQATPNFRGLGDPLTDADIQALHMYGTAYRYKRTPGFTRPGVAALRSR